VLKLTTATAATTLALGANAMTLNGMLVSNGATTGGAVTISGTGVLGAGATSEFILNNYSTSALTINAPLISTTATTGSLTKTGYGTVIITTATGNNAFTGAVTVNQGELQSYLVSPGTTTARTAGTYTPFGTGAITVNAGTNLRFKAGSTTNAFTYANAINLRDGTLISDDGASIFSGAINSTGFSSIQTVWSGKTATFSGVISGSGFIDLTATGNISLTNAANTFSGYYTLKSGTLVLGGAATSLGAAAGLIVNAGATATWDRSTTTSSLFTNAGAVVELRGTNLSTATLNLVQSYASTGTNAALTIPKVTLNYGTILGGASVGTQYSRLIGGLEVVAGTANTLRTSSGSYGRGLIIEGEVSGSGSLTIDRQGNGSGSWIGFRGNMVGYSGAISTNASSQSSAGYTFFGGAGGWGSGLLTLGASSAASTIIGDPGASVSSSGGTPAFITGTMNIQGSATLGAGSSLLLLNQSGTAFVSAEIAGSVTLNAATLGLYGTYASAGSFIPYTNATWTVGGSAVSTISAPLSINYSGVTFDVGDSVGGSGTDLLVSGVVKGSKQLTKSGAGTMAFTSANTTTGGFNIAAGTINLGNGSSASGDLGSGTIAIGASGTVALNRTADTTTANTFTGTGTISKIQGTAVETLSGNLSGFSGTIAIQTGASAATPSVLSLASGTSTTAAVTVGQFGALRSNGTATVGNVTLVSGGNLQVQVGTPTTDTSFFTTAGTFTFVTGSGIVVSNTSGIDAGTYRILNYGSGALTYNGGTDITGLTASGLAPSRNTFSLSNDTVNKTLDMIVTGVAANLIWNGSASTWDSAQATAAAWNNTGTSASDVFYNYDNATLDDSIVSSAQTITLSGTIAPGSITVSGAQDYTLTGTGLLSGGANITKNGSGTLRLENSGTNALAGSITVNGGKLAVTSAYTMSNGGLTLNSGTTFANSTAGTPKTVGKNLTVNGTVNFGDATDTGALTFSASTSIANGATINAVVATGFTGTTTVTGLTGLTFTGAGGTTISSALAFAGNTTFTVSGAGGATLNGILSGTGYSLTKEGAGKLTLGGANTYSGGTTINAGTVQFGTGAATTVLPAGAVSIASGSTLAIYNSTNGLAVANTISGAGTISLMGSGAASTSSYSFSGIASTFTGNWSVGSGARLNAATQAALGVNSGTITVASGGGLYLSGTPATYTNNIVIAGTGWVEGTLAPLGAIRFNSASTTTGTITLAGNANITAYGTTGTITGNIGESVVGSVLTYGNATLAANSSGTLTVNGTNTYTGGTNLAGVVTVNANSSGAFGTGTVTVGGSALYASLLTLANGVNLANAVTLNANAGNANGVVQISGANSATISGLVTLGAAAPATGNFFGVGTGTLSLLGGISSATNVAFGAGNYVLGGGGTYTTLSTAGGSLKLGTANGIATGATLTLGSTSAATFDLNGNSQSNAITLTPGAAGLSVTNTGSTASLNLANTGTTAFNIGGNVALILSGSGVKGLSGSNTYTGGTTVTNGSLEITALSAIGTGGLNLDGGNFKLTQSTAAALGGALAGSGSFTKEGSGTLTLGTVSGFTGALAVNAGSVIVSGNSLGGSTGAGSLISIADGASLSGGFSTARDITVMSSELGFTNGGTLRAGTGLTTGTLATTGTLTFDGGFFEDGISQLNVLIGNSSADTINLTGGTLNLSGLVNVSFLNGGMGTGTYNILTYDVNNASNVLTGTLTRVGDYGHTAISNVVHDTVNGIFSVDVTKASMIWVGNVSGDVDATTANFKLSTTSAADTLLAGDELIFNDTATTRAVNLDSSMLAVAKVTVDTDLGYSIGGTGVLAGANAQLVKNGSGVLTLAGTHSFGGGTYINAGTLAVAADGALGASAGTINLAAGTTLQATGTFALGSSRAVVLGGNASVAVDSAATLSYAGSITGSSSLTKTGNGTLSLSGASIYTGGTNVNAGTLDLAGNNALLATGAVTVNGGTLSIGTTTQTFGTLTVSSGSISNTGTITAATLAVTGGTLAGTINAANYSFADTITIASGATLGGSATLTKSTSGTLAIASVLANTGGVSVSNGTLRLSGTNTYTGGTTLSGGTLQVSSTGALGAASATLALNGGTISSDSTTGRTVTAAGASTIGGNVTFGDAINTGALTLTNAFNLGGATRTLTAASDATLSGVISNGGITKIGTGTLNLNAANTYNSGLTVSAGTIATTNAQGLGATTNTVTLSPGSSNASILINYGLTTVHNISVSGTGTGTATLGSIYNAGAGLNTQYSGIITLGRDVTLMNNGGDRTTFAGKITGTGNITISSPNTAGRVTFVHSAVGSANDFVGDITLAADTQLQLGAGSNTNNYAIPDASSIYFTNSASYLRLSGSGGTAAESVNALISNAAGAGLIQATESAGTLTIGAGNGSGTFSGVIGNNQVLNIVKAGSGNQTLTGNNTFIGTTTLSAGTLTLGHSSALGMSTLTLGGGTLVLNPTITSFSFGGLAAASAGTGYDILLSTATETAAAIALTVGSNNNSTTYTGVLSGLGSLTKVGTGNLILSGANTYTGSTSINAGTLTIADGNALASGSAISLATGAALSVSGTASTLANNIAIGATAGTAYIATPNTSATSLNGVISGGGAGVVLYLQGGASGQNTGAITLAGNNTFAGTISVQRGPVILGNANAAGSAVIELNSNAPAAGALQFGDSFTVNNNVSLVAGALVGVASDKTNTLSGVVSGASVLNKVGAGTLVLTGANTFTGGATVTAGTLQLGAANALPGISGTLTTSGGTLDLGGYTVTTTGTLAANSGSVTNGTITAGSYASSGNATISAVLAGSGTFTKTGASTTTTVTNATYTGATSVTSGTLTFAGENTGSTAVTVNGGTFATTSGTNTIASLSLQGSSALNVSGGTLNVVGSIATTGSTGSSWTIGTGATVNAANFGNAWNPNSFTVNGTLNLSSTLASAFNQATNGTMTVGGTGTLNISGGYTNANNAGTVTTIEVSRMNIGGGAAGASVAGITRSQGTIILGSASKATTIGVFTRNWSSSAAMSIGTAGVTFDTQDSVDGTTGRSITLSGVLSNNTSNVGTVTKAGAGTLTLSGANTFSGALTVNGGTLNLNGTHQSVASIAANNGSTINFNATNVLVGGHGTTAADSRTISATGGSSLVFGSGMEARLGNINLSGSTFTSNRGLSSYDMLLANVASGAATVTVTGSTASTMNGTGGLHLAGVQNFSVANATGDSAADLVVSMQLSDGGVTGGTGGINKTGAGTMSLTNANNNFTGDITVGAGALEVGGAGRLNAGSYAGTVTNNGALNISTSANQTLSGAVSGAGSLAKSGNGTLTLSGSNSHSGSTDITAGSLVVSNANSLGSGSYSIGANGTLTLGYSIADGSSFASTLTGSGLFEVGGAGTFSLTNASTFTGTASILAGSFNMTGYTGQVRLNGGTLANLGSYVGTLEVGTGSTLDVSTLPNTASIVLKSGGTLDFGSASGSTLSTSIVFQGGSLTNASAFTGNIVVSGTGVSIGAGALGGGTLVVGTGTSVNFTGANSNTVNATGGLITGGSNLTGTVLATSGTFKIGASTGQAGIDALTISATVSLGGATLDLNASTTAANITYSSGSITNAANYTGTVTLASGSNLTMNGTIGGTIAVGDGATLSGNGTFSNVTVADGGVLSPGNSPGIQTFTGSLALDGGSSWDVQVYSTQAVLTSGDENGQNVGARGYDTIQITGSELFGGGSFDLSGASSVNKITLNLMTLANWSDSVGGISTNGLLDLAPGQLEQTFVLATYSNSATLAEGETITSIFAFNTTGYYINGQAANSSQFSVSEFFNGDTSLTELTLTVVPEPSTYGMILGGLALAAAAIRRRKQAKLNS
jgi:autotransporter-associated beta strand protein